VSGEWSLVSSKWWKLGHPLVIFDRKILKTKQCNIERFNRRKLDWK